MVSANINSSRIIHEAHSNEATNHLDLTSDYSNGGNLQLVNFLPNEVNLLHHHKVSKVLKAEKFKQDQDIMRALYNQDQSTTIITSSNIQSQQTSLPLLTPLKYVEYHSNIVGAGNEEQLIIAEAESDKSDCESGDHELHKTPSKLPHKKRIAKKLNSNQPYNHQEFSLMMPTEDPNMRNMQAQNVRTLDLQSIQICL